MTDFFDRYVGEPVSMLLALPWMNVSLWIDKPGEHCPPHFKAVLAPNEVTNDMLFNLMAEAKEKSLQFSMGFMPSKVLLSDGLTVMINEDLIVTRCVEACLGG
jgi:hypothetical protein